MNNKRCAWRALSCTVKVTHCVTSLGGHRYNVCSFCAKYLSEALHLGLKSVMPIRVKICKKCTPLIICKRHMKNVKEYISF